MDYPTPNVAVLGSCCSVLFVLCCAVACCPDCYPDCYPECYPDCCPDCYPDCAVLFCNVAVLGSGNPLRVHTAVISSNKGAQLGVGITSNIGNRPHKWITRPQMLQFWGRAVVCCPVLFCFVVCCAVLRRLLYRLLYRLCRLLYRLLPRLRLLLRLLPRLCCAVL